MESSNTVVHPEVLNACDAILRFAALRMQFAFSSRALKCTIVGKAEISEKKKKKRGFMRKLGDLYRSYLALWSSWHLSLLLFRFVYKLKWSSDRSSVKLHDTQNLIDLFLFFFIFLRKRQFVAFYSTWKFAFVCHCNYASSGMLKIVRLSVN